MPSKIIIRVFALSMEWSDAYLSRPKANEIMAVGTRAAVIRLKYGWSY